MNGPTRSTAHGAAPRARGSAAGADAAACELAATMWRERELLDSLLFALTTQQLVLRAGELRWLTATDSTVSLAVAALADCELRRAIHATELAAALGLRADASLEELATSAPEPWDLLLADHREALRALSGEITAASAENRRLLHAGAEATREALSHVGSAIAGYADAVGADALSSRPVLIDRQA